MKRARAHPSDEDAERLFRAAVADAQPLPDSGRAHVEAPRPRPLPRQSARDEHQALHESLHECDPLALCLEGGDEAAWLRPGLARSTLRDLRRGRWVREDQLDLHGCTREGARELLAGFLAECLRRGLRCVRVIHGKGLRSPGREPVLKHWVHAWLARRAEVLAFCQARAAEGGAGAVVVLLKAPR